MKITLRVYYGDVFEVSEEPFTIFHKIFMKPPYIGRLVGTISEDGMGYTACYHDIKSKKEKFRLVKTRSDALSWIRNSWKSQLPDEPKEDEE